MQRTEVPIFSHWIENADLVRRILDTNKVYVYAVFSEMRYGRLASYSVCISNETKKNRSKENSCALLKYSDVSSDQYAERISEWVSQAEVSMLLFLLTIEGFEVLVEIYKESEPELYSDRFSDFLSAKKCPKLENPEGDMDVMPFKKVPPLKINPLMKKFDPSQYE